MVKKIIIEKSGVEKSEAEKFMFEKSGFEAWCWKSVGKSFPQVDYLYISREIENLRSLISRFLREVSSWEMWPFTLLKIARSLYQSQGCISSWDVDGISPSQIKNPGILKHEKPNRPRWFRHPWLGNKGSRQLSYNVLIFAVSHTSSCAEYSIPLWRERGRRWLVVVFLNFLRLLQSLMG